jgi:hypothetical protein
MPWGVWAGTVRQDVEACHGVAYPAPIEEADPVVLPGERLRIEASGFVSPRAFLPVTVTWGGDSCFDGPEHS